MGRRKKVCEENKVTYSKNEEYSQEDVTKLIRIYHMALDAGDNATIQDISSRIYAMTEKFVYKTLWTNYRTLMQNRYHREDIVQEVWVRIFNELKNYDPEKAAITTFIIPWIRHVISDYSSRNFRRTSVYYANAMSRVCSAQNYAKQYGLDPEDIDTLMNLTGLTRITVKNTLELISRKDTVSYEALADAGADYTSQIKGPEESFLELESERALIEILNDILDDEEKVLLKMLLNPGNPSKKHASYREITEQIPGSNVPKIKRQISKIVTKLKNDRRFAQMYPYIAAQEKALEKGYMPVLDEDGDTSDIDEEYADFESGD